MRRRDKGSFEALYADWDAATSVGLRARTVDQRRREIDKDLVPVFRERPVASITRLKLTTTLKAVEARAPEVARNLRNHLWGIFDARNRRASTCSPTGWARAAQWPTAA
jgi:hypothetical protein